MCLFPSLGSFSDYALPSFFLGTIWLSTALFQMPLHLTPTKEMIPKLVKSNWIRTISWTLRSALHLRLVLSRYTLPP